MTVVGSAEKLANECYKHLDRLMTERENFDKMLAYAGKYQITIQFLGEGNTNFYIMKDHVELTDGGGLSPVEAIARVVEYLDRINRVKPI